MCRESPIFIDIRPENEFVAGHHVLSAHFNGLQALSNRQYELPEPQKSMTFVCNAEDESALRLWLSSKGYDKAGILCWSPAYQQQLIDQQALASGASLAYVWQPSAVLKAFVETVSALDQPVMKKGLDIGCGAGRDLVYLAMNGWQMTGVDIRAEMLEKAQALAERHQVKIVTLERDCEAVDDPFQDIADASFDLIHVARYLHRPLFPVLKRLLAPNGYLIYHTFMQGCEAFGSPKNPRFLLTPGELSQVFSDYERLRDEVITLADGRPMSAFIVRKITDE